MRPARTMAALCVSMVALLAQSAESSQQPPRLAQSPNKGWRGPHRAVAVSEEARLVVIRVPSGRVVRVLVDLSHRVKDRWEFPIESVSMSPDNRFVYYTDVKKDRTHVIKRVRTRGGSPQRIALGTSPAVSNDGTKLAFAFSDGRFGGFNSLAVRDLMTNETTRWRYDDNEEDFFQTGGHIDRISWSPADRKLSYTIEYEGSELRVLDLAEDNSMSENRLVNGNASPVWLRPRRVASVESCCFPEYRRLPGRAVMIDPRNGDRVRGLSKGMTVRSIDVSARRRVLAITREHDLFAIGRQMHAKKVGADYVLAVWAGS